MKYSPRTRKNQNIKKESWPKDTNIQELINASCVSVHQKSRKLIQINEVFLKYLNVIFTVDLKFF